MLRPLPQRRIKPPIGPFELEDVPLRVSTFAFDQVLRDVDDVKLVTEIDVRGLAFQETSGRFEDALAFLVEAQHRETGEYCRYDQKIEPSLLPETRQRLSETWYPVMRDFSLPPGGYQAKVVVRDLGSGRVGSVVHEFEVPEPAALRISTPILSATLQPGTDGSQRPVLRVRRVFAPDSILYCQFSVYSALRETTGSLMPQDCL